jgi:hydroxyacid-oxoacid transhydrogenase
VAGAGPEDAGEIMAEAVIDVMRKAKMPNGLRAVGYTPDDVDDLVAGVLPQHRVIKLSPRPADADDFRQMFLDSMTIW